MCGIAGLITCAPWRDEHLDQLKAMTTALRHRGPDDAGIEVVHTADPGVGFGHRRLAIIDLSPAGHQPMADPDTGNWISFNGEIYNYRQLRRDLECRGYIFRSQTDTEVILKAYAMWGLSFVRYLRGIFAVAIWDSRSQTLVLARDQLGVKPLYHWHENNLLLFASEVRALLAAEVIPRNLDPIGIRSYLGYGAVQEPFTLIRGVQSLPPGHILTWHAGQTTLRRYWKLPAADTIPASPPVDLFEQIANQLAEAVRLQLVSDVPLGAFLSGGIDSTAIAALMRGSTNGAVKTFSVVFDEKAYDEREYARIAARHLGTDHVELHLSDEAVLEALPAVLAAFDQPSVDGVNTYFVSKVTREAGLTVALSGLGGDELFGGYNGYRKALFLERWAGRSKWVHPLVRAGAAVLIGQLPGGPVIQRVSDFLQMGRHPYFASRQIFTTRQVAALLDPEVMHVSDGWDSRVFGQLERETQDYDLINRVSALELQTYMLSMLLRDADQMSMAHALELRVPLIDHVLVEQIFALPGACKIDPMQPKPLLTRTLDGVLPDKCVHRPKHGFTLPFAVWLRRRLQAEMQAAFLSHASLSAAPFRAQGLASLWNSFERGQIGWSRIWGLFVLRDWLTRYDVRC